MFQVILIKAKEMKGLIHKTEPEGCPWSLQSCNAPNIQYCLIYFISITNDKYKAYKIEDKDKRVSYFTI